MTQENENVKNNKNNKTSRRARTLGRKILPICALFLCIAAAFGGAAAWVTVNRRTKSNGIEMTAQTSGNLVISDDADAIADEDILNNGSPFTVTLEAPADPCLPAAHDTSIAKNAQVAAPDQTSGLVYVADGKTVDAATGAAKSGSLSYSVVDPGDTQRYVDYEVYIACAGKALTGQKLYVTISSADTLSDTAAALSVDFYVKAIDTASSYTYVNTLNLAGRDRWAAAGTALTSLQLLGGVTVPLNTEGHMVVLMRVYYDGGLIKSGTTTYVRSAALDTDPVSFTVSFTAE